MSDSLVAVLDRLEADRPAAVNRFKELLAIPSVGTDPACAADTARAAQWVAQALGQAGLDAKAYPTVGNPIVMGHTRAEDVDPKARTRVLFYGHYDVQPADPLELWETPPFEPTLRHGAMVARGASDDKGPICCFIEALRAWKSVSGKLPVHLTVLIEGEEESGAANLKPFIEAHKQELAADVVLVSDSYIWNNNVPAITYGLRGMVYFDVQLHGPQRDLHSGTYGGSVPNPAVVLTQVLGRLFDDQRRLTIPGFYDDVRPVTAAEREQWATLGFDEAKALEEIGVAKPLGEQGYSMIERLWARPACDINGLYGGYGGPGAKTIIPSFAGAKVSFRIPPAMKADKVTTAFQTWLESQEVYGLRWEITPLGACDPAMVSSDSRYIHATAQAIQGLTGQKPVLIREGATIPVIIDFKRILGLDSVMVGFSAGDDRVHSPNEQFGLDRFYLGARIHAAILAAMGALSAT